MVPSMYELICDAELVTVKSLFRQAKPHLDATGMESASIGIEMGWGGMGVGRAE